MHQTHFCKKGLYKYKIKYSADKRSAVLAVRTAESDPEQNQNITQTKTERQRRTRAFPRVGAAAFLRVVRFWGLPPIPFGLGHLRPVGGAAGVVGQALEHREILPEVHGPGLGGVSMAHKVVEALGVVGLLPGKSLSRYSRHMTR